MGSPETHNSDAARPGARHSLRCRERRGPGARRPGPSEPGALGGGAGAVSGKRGLSSESHRRRGPRSRRLPGPAPSSPPPRVRLRARSQGKRGDRLYPRGGLGLRDRSGSGAEAGTRCSHRHLRPFLPPPRPCSPPDGHIRTLGVASPTAPSAAPEDRPADRLASPRGAATGQAPCSRRARRCPARLGRSSSDSGET